METELKSPVPQTYAGKSLLDYLCARFRYQTREAWEALIAERKVTINGEKAQPGRAVLKGDLVAYRVTLNEPAVDTRLRILLEEEALVVAYKPGMLPSHSDGTFITQTFIALLNKRLDPAKPVKLVHRLDRETSGIMVCARQKEAHKRLTRQFEEGSVKKTYLAIVPGKPERDAFMVEGFIAKDPGSKVSIRHRCTPQATEGGKSSLTRFEVAERHAHATLLRCFPETGRTNQIRVHLASAGLPILGDKLYGRSDDEFLAFVAHVKAGGDPGFCPPLPVPRHFLHAAKLEFTHPLSGARLSFEEPLPEDMREYLLTPAPAPPKGRGE